MKNISLAVAAAALLCGSVSVGLAQGLGTGKTDLSPGHEMQEHGSKPGSPGASGYAPGHQDRDDMHGLRDQAGDKDLHGLRDQAGDKDHGLTRDRDDTKLGKDRDDMHGLRDQAGGKDMHGLRDRDGDKDRDLTRDRDDTKSGKDRDDIKGDLR
jgi:hypothetical protein